MQEVGNVQNVLFCSVSLIMSIGNGFKLNLIIQPQSGLYDITTGIFFQVDKMISININFKVIVGNIS